jgi:hypothetical protein
MNKTPRYAAANGSRHAFGGLGSWPHTAKPYRAGSYRLSAGEPADRYMARWTSSSTLRLEWSIKKVRPGLGQEGKPAAGNS